MAASSSCRAILPVPPMHPRCRRRCARRWTIGQPPSKLLMLLDDISFRNLIPGELAKGFGFLQGKGQTAFSPVAVTPDELGAAFDGKKVHLPLLSQINGKPF